VKWRVYRFKLATTGRRVNPTEKERCGRALPSGTSSSLTKSNSPREAVVTRNPGFLAGWRDLGLTAIEINWLWSTFSACRKPEENPLKNWQTQAAVKNSFQQKECWESAGQQCECSP
jgi:hypothetical protein